MANRLLYVCLDGLGDDPIPELGDRTPLEAARTPSLDSLAERGRTGNVVTGKGTVIEDGATIKGPVIIGRDCEIRANAYLRGNVIVGDGCVLGNACEFKNSLLFNNCNVPHFSYVGDSILGYKAHLGAGVKISNIKIVPGNVTVEKGGVPFDTGLRKFGALIGDGTDIGCNATINPGSIIGRGVVIYPGVSWRGILPSNMIVKNRAEQQVVVRRPRSS